MTGNQKGSIKSLRGINLTSGGISFFHILLSTLPESVRHVPRGGGLGESEQVIVCAKETCNPCTTEIDVWLDLKVTMRIERIIAETYESKQTDEQA